MNARFDSFAEFYPFYLSEHGDRTSRRLHFIGSCGVLAVAAVAIATGDLRWLIGALFCGCGFAWVGHFFFEKNRPATFKHPMPQLTRIAAYKGAAFYLRCQYQANVMKTFDASSSKMGEDAIYGRHGIPSVVA